MSTNTVRVYLPKQCLVEDNGQLIGSFDEIQMICCITGLLRVKNDYKSLPLRRLESCTSGVIGVWKRLSSSKDTEDGSDSVDVKNTIFLKISQDSSNRLQAESKAFGLTTSFVIILYNAQQFIRSLYVEQKIVSLPNDHDKTNLAILSRAFNLHRQYLGNEVKESEKAKIRDFTKNRTRLVHTVVKCLLSWLVQLTVVFTSLATRFSFHIGHSRMGFVKNYTVTSALVTQVRHKLSHLSIRANAAAQSRHYRLCFMSCVSLFSLDVIVGTCLMLWLLHSYDFPHGALHLFAFAESVATELNKLLNWMMGVPAGLKLNQPLAHFLGNFFLYHIFLWKAYLGALKPIAGVAIQCTCFTGCLGITVQLAIIQDLISMMTLHIYCFYVYAARLYNLQLSALSSLWRLFRGKKWNSLRGRVDSATYDIDQLFLGTLLFTALLFLLPTTGLFYAVFVVLRLLVLIGHGVIAKTITFVNNLPAYWLLLRLFQPDVVSGDVLISIHQRSPLGLELKLKPASLSELYQLDNVEHLVGSSSPPSQDSWRDLFGKLLSGELIYPWWTEQT